jgi:hypothetical protein
VLATWKRLTGLRDNEKVDVNFDHVAYMQWAVNETTIYFASSSLDVRVKETPDEIHMAEGYRPKADGAI